MKKWATFALRWGIAVAGITYVVWNLHFRDRIKVLTPANGLADLQLLDATPETAATFRAWGRLSDAEAPAEHVIPRDQVWTNRSDHPTVQVRTPGGPRAMAVVAIRPPPSKDQPPAGGEAIAPKLLVQEQGSPTRRVIDPADVVAPPGYKVPSYPLVEIGLNHMVRDADWKFLLAAVAVMPVSYLLTSYRWHLLLGLLGIDIRQSRAFVINMVGAFYNSFMPGSTGGDVAKAYYASKHTPHRTRAVMSVLVDRAVGLLALVLLGGTMAAFQYRQSLDCRRVAIASAVLLAGTAVGLVVFYHPALRRLTGLDWIFNRLPMQPLVQNAVHAMELYGRRPGAMAGALLLCFPVHVTSIISATFAGQAFRLDLPLLYYWVIVPVIALVGAVPISPQGAGVMEFFAINLTTKRYPVSVGQAVALVLAIRLVQIFWNLIAGLFVLRSGYHAPTEAEQHELEEDEGTGFGAQNI